MICFVEDDENIRKLVCYALTKEGYEVQGFPNAKEFWEGINLSIPKLVLLDIMLPGEDGLSILKKLQETPETENVPVIMISAKSSEFDKVKGLDMGADDYISKPFGITELSSRVNAVLRRYEKTQTKKTVYTLRNLYVDTQRHIVKIDNKEIKLPYKEYLLLVNLLSAQGKVVSREELLNRIWGEYYEESRTLDVHIRRLRRKLETVGDVIETIKNVGYKIGGAENGKKDIS